MLDKIKNLDKKTLLYLGVGVGAVVFLIIFLFILKMVAGGRINSSKFEKRVKNAAITYYEKYPDKLPKISGNKVEITIDELVKSGTLKEPNKLLDKGLTCEGKVNVSNNNGYYLYQPILKCSDEYETDLLYKKILKDNPIVTSSNGLYKVNDYYLFRGENLNNYVKFGNMKFQIIRINSDNTIRMILIDDVLDTVWDDRYNNKTGSAVGKNDFTISRIREQLDKYFKDTEIFNENMKKLIVPQDLCIGARSETSTINDGSLECAKKLEKQPIGLLQVNEYMLATIESTCKHLFDNQCTNYNYLANIRNTWTLTPNSGNTYEVYRVSKFVYSNDANDTSQPRFVITISSDALFDKGSGTEEDPYIMKEN